MPNHRFNALTGHRGRRIDHDTTIGGGVDRIWGDSGVHIMFDETLPQAQVHERVVAGDVLQHAVVVVSGVSAWIVQRGFGTMSRNDRCEPL